MLVGGEVGSGDFGWAAAAGARAGLDGDCGAFLQAWKGCGDGGGEGSRGVQFGHAVAVGEVGRGGHRGVEGAGGVEEALEVGCDGAFGGGVVHVVEEAVEGCFGWVEVCGEGGVGGCFVGQGGHGGDGGFGRGFGALLGGEPGAAFAFAAALVVLVDVAG